jgi:predicted phosphoribosyltransferase
MTPRITPPFRDRMHAGLLLGRRLRDSQVARGAVVLALPRGGVPVAAGVAEALSAPLDVLVVRKLGAPGREELAIGAIARGARVLNRGLIRELGIDQDELDAIQERELAELGRRERLYREGVVAPPVAGATAIVVDDGLATGSTMIAAVQAIRAAEPAAVVVAVPVADAEVCGMLREAADEVLCLVTPHPLGAIGLYYEDFSQTGDDEVRSLLAAARERTA